MSSFLSPQLCGLCAYIPGEQPRGTQFIKLNTNENPYPPSPMAIAQLTKKNGEALRKYSDPTAHALTNSIASFYNIEQDNIVVANGSDEILAFIFYAYGLAKTTAFADITYGFYKVFAQLYNLKTRVIPLEKDYSIDIASYLQSGENVIIANPNAPTGIAIPLIDIEKICLAHKDDIVIIDEAYTDFGGESAVSLIDKFSNLVVVQTFSKSRSLAGARVGFAIACRELCADLQRIRNSFNPYNVNTISQALATFAMDDIDYFNNCTQKIIATREIFTSSLLKMGFEVLKSSANFVFAKKRGFSGVQIYDKLKENNILVRYFDDARTKDFVRISIGSEDEMETTVAVLNKILAQN